MHKEIVLNLFPSPIGELIVTNSMCHSLRRPASGLQFMIEFSNELMTIGPSLESQVILISIGVRLAVGREIRCEEWREGSISHIWYA